MNTLAERSVLMKFSGGLPGAHREDRKTTGQVIVEKCLGLESGKWVKDLYPKHALKALKTALNEARAYHNSVTLPFGVRGDDASEDSKTPAIAGIGILPAALIEEYKEKMMGFRDKISNLLENGFLANPDEWIAWARLQHNGTFDPANYPGCTADSFDAEEFRTVMRKKVYIRTEPLPVPDSGHFSAMVAGLLGTDSDSVDIRVRDSGIEAARELMRRLIQPVTHMAARCAGAVCQCSECKGKLPATDSFKDTLVGNIADIVRLAPALNLTGDPQIDAFAKEVEALAQYKPETLRTEAQVKAEAAAKADAIAKRMSAYKL